MATEAVVERALRGVLRDYGWRVASDPARLRAMLSDVLGADAAENRGLVDALVLAAEHDVPAELGETDGTSPELVGRLESWGLLQERAEWAVAAWAAVTPRGTDPAPGTTPPPDPAPAPAPAPLPLEATALPPEYAATVLPPAPVGPVPAPAVTTPLAEAEPRSWWRRRALLATAAVVALLLVGGGIAAATRGGGHDRPTAGRTTPASSPAAAAQVATLVTDRAATPKPLAHPVGMASKEVGVGLMALSDVPETHLSAGESVGPPAGGRLIAFRISRWSCQDSPHCGPGGKVHVEVDGRHRSLAGHGPYVVAVAADTSTADLVMKADGVTQRISLLTGEADSGNVEVLARPHHSMKIHERFQVTSTTSIPITYVDGHAGTYHHLLDITIDGAELDYFLGGSTPRDTSHAFLSVNYWFGYDDDPNAAKQNYVLDEAEVTFVSRDGTVYHAKDLDTREAYAQQVFEVPASVVGGRFVIGGPQTTPKLTTAGGHFTQQIARHSVRLTF